MTDQHAEPVGSLATALAHTARLLGSDPAMAEAQATEILKVVPGHPEAELLRGAARRVQGRAAAARELLEPLSAAQPRWPAVQLELGLALADLGLSREAVEALSRAVQLNPALAIAWRALGDQFALLGQSQAADDAYARQIRASVNDPVLLEAANALCENRLAVAERQLRGHLKTNPTDVAAIRMLAEVGARLGRYEDAEALLERCLELAPSFTAARYNYAVVLNRQTKGEEAIAQIDQLLVRDPRNPAYRSLRAACLGRIGEYEQTISAYSELLQEYPDQPKAWMSLGHALKTVGRQQESIAAYQKSVVQLPSLGEAYWSLANLKTFRFAEDAVEAMKAQLERSDLENEDRFHLHFALGKALEDAGQYEASFAHYAKGAALRRAVFDYDAEETASHVRRSKALFTPEFFAERQGRGCQREDPIFIVGLPRAGSTLIEQILASHSAVEGTMELPDITALARRIGGKSGQRDGAGYPGGLEALGPEQLEALGEDYLRTTAIQRKLGRPFFIDKMPNNFAHVGLIHLILPKARIIDARRHPLACCLSGFKQHFARGQRFSYDLSDIGRYYADYVELMAHFDEVLPGRVHRVIHEALVTDPEAEIRRLLDYCDLPFEEGCLRFYENERPVRTASSEQVRRPISAEGLDQWKRYEPWLGPLKAALGPVLDAYPEAPSFGAK